jgi:hypothetical protein
MFIDVRRELENLHVGSIKLILVHNQAAYFLVEPQRSPFNSDMTVLVVDYDSGLVQYECIAMTRLM